jgi:hypothetical protein
MSLINHDIFRKLLQNANPRNLEPIFQLVLLEAGYPLDTQDYQYPTHTTQTLMDRYVWADGSSLQFNFDAIGAITLATTFPAIVDRQSPDDRDESESFTGPSALYLALDYLFG